MVSLEMLLSLIIYLIQILLPFLAFVIIYNCFKSLMSGNRDDRPLIVLFNKNNKEKIPVLYWENSIGRSKSSDIVLEGMAVSRDHAVLFRRDKGWIIADTNSKMGVSVNGKKINENKKVELNDVINIGGNELVIIPFETGEPSQGSVKNKKNRKTGQINAFQAVPPRALLILVNVFHFFASLTVCLDLKIFKLSTAIAFLMVTFLIWISYIKTKYVFRRVNFELETLGFFLSGIGVITISTLDMKQVYTQITAISLGVTLFFFILIFIKNPDLAMKFRPYIALLAVLLFCINLIFGKIKNGSQNWIDIHGISVQPSEMVKVAFVFVGASTLEKLQTAKNLTGFILFSAVCMLFLFLMGDFGTACIFFAAFLVIAFMRSGNIRTLVLICSGAAIGSFMVLKFKPYIMGRFSAWRHVWEYPDSLGYQQTRVLTYSASGGLFGVGIGKGCLKYVFASTTDLMFGMLCEEWGLLIALSVAICIILIGFYAISTNAKSRSAFYSIASCAAAGILVCQTGLNVFGSTDILPLTGVTLPFVSLGGSSMVCVWGLLAFIKASDERTYAVRR